MSDLYRALAALSACGWREARDALALAGFLAAVLWGLPVILIGLGWV